MFFVPRKILLTEWGCGIGNSWWPDNNRDPCHSNYWIYFWSVMPISGGIIHGSLESTRIFYLFSVRMSLAYCTLFPTDCFDFLQVVLKTLHIYPMILFNLHFMNRCLLFFIFIYALEIVELCLVVFVYVRMFLAYTVMHLEVFDILNCCTQVKNLKIL